MSIECKVKRVYESVNTVIRPLFKFFFYFNEKENQPVFLHFRQRNFSLIVSDVQDFSCNAWRYNCLPLCIYPTCVFFFNSHDVANLK